MEYLAMIWDAYGRSAEAVFNFIHGLAPEAHFVAFVVAVLWPFLIAFAVMWLFVHTHDRITMRRIRRDIARRTSTLRDRSN